MMMKMTILICLKKIMKRAKWSMIRIKSQSTRRIGMITAHSQTGR